MYKDHIQAELDGGKSMAAIARDLGVHHETLRRFIIRNKLEVYEAFDEVLHAIPIHDVEMFAYIDVDFKVCFDEIKLKDISTSCHRPVGELKSSIKTYVDSLEMDALDEYVRSLDFDEVNNAAITKHRHIVHYIYKHCGSFEGFREMFGVDFDIVSYSSDNERAYFVNAGHRFEKMVGDALKEIHGNGNTVNDKFYLEGCLPDFVVADRWIDAKLSKSTAISPSCKTIERYSKHTDNLSIIYCIDDINDVPEEYSEVDFIHITELYPYISDELMCNISELKAEVQRRKAGVLT